MDVRLSPSNRQRSRKFNRRPPLSCSTGGWYTILNVLSSARDDVLTMLVVTARDWDADASRKLGFLPMNPSKEVGVRVEQALHRPPPPLFHLGTFLLPPRLSYGARLPYVTCFNEE